METTKSTAQIVNLVLKAIALAMGVASVVLNIMGTDTLQGTGTLLGLGLTCLAITALQ